MTASPPCSLITGGRGGTIQRRIGVLLVLSGGRDTDLLPARCPTRTNTRLEVDNGFVEIERVDSTTAARRARIARIFLFLLRPRRMRTGRARVHATPSFGNRRRTKEA